jgi:hypothetical protein
MVKINATEMAAKAKARRKAEHLKMLREEFANFLEAYLIESDGFLGQFMPLRMIPITGLIAWELAHAGFIEIHYGKARPALGARK